VSSPTGFIYRYEPADLGETKKTSISEN